MRQTGGRGTPSRDFPQSLKMGPSDPATRQQIAPVAAPFAWQAIAHWNGDGASPAIHAGVSTVKAR